MPTADSFRSTRADSLISAWVSSIGSASRPAEELVDPEDGVGRRVLVLDEHFLEEPVARRVEQQAMGGLAVSTGPPGLLVIGFERPRQVEMDHRADVGFVDAHPEGVGRDDDLGLPGHESVLGLGAFVAGEARVVDDHLAAEFLLEVLADRLALRPARGVDDGRAGGLAQRLGQRGELVVVAPGLDDGVAQVGAVEPGDELGVVAEVELVGDVAADDVGRRGGEGDAGGRADLSTGQADPGVVGAEVVAPLADAVRLVDRQE